MTYRTTNIQCKRCGGTGYLEIFSHVSQGHCLQCQGTGFKEAKKQWYGLTQVNMEGVVTKLVVFAYDEQDAKERANPSKGEVVKATEITKQIAENFVKRFGQTFTTIKS